MIGLEQFGAQQNVLTLRGGAGFRGSADDDYASGVKAVFGCRSVAGLALRGFLAVHRRAALRDHRPDADTRVVYVGTGQRLDGRADEGRGAVNQEQADKSYSPDAC